jgi:hypothetical protein
MTDRPTITNIMANAKLLTEATIPPQSFMGFKLIASPFVPDEIPAIQMHPDCDPHGLWCTPAFRADTNRWLLERFGTKQVAYVLSREQMITMSDRMMRRLEADLDLERVLYAGCRP